MTILIRAILPCLTFLALVAGPAMADDDLQVKINGSISSILVETEDGPVKIMRNQDTDAVIDEKYAKTSRACPPFCVQPMQVAPGVVTVGEVEVITFLKNGGKLIDGRTEEWHLDGTIPGAINIPYTLAAQNLDQLGCVKAAGKWDCAQAETVMLFCNGPWCGQSPMAIKAMLREGYPADRIFYYRGGMQGWHALGLTVVEGSF